MSIQLGAAPESSFDDPLGLLSDCHRRIERFLRQLLLVTNRAAMGQLDGETRHALEVALRYFREAAPRHTRDEEDSLFPRLRDSGDPTARQALSIMEALESDHAAADVAHIEVDRIGMQWLKEGHIGPDDISKLRRLLTDLQNLYARHIDIEDTILFPSAACALSAQAVSQIGREMAERRGIDLDSLPEFTLRCPTKRVAQAAGRPDVTLPDR